MQAEIIAVGTEILLGQIDNTNASYVARGLADLGISVFHQQVVGDNGLRLEDALSLAEQRSDLVVVMGGLGPTKDDLTKQIVARHLHRTLVEDEVAMGKIKLHYQRSDRPMGDNDRLQALYISGGQSLANHNGMAVGDFIHQENWADFLVLPGPPRELMTMFTSEAVPLLKQTYFQLEHLTSRVLRFFGIGEAALARKLDDLISEQTNPTLATYAKDAEVTLRLTASGPSIQDNETRLDNLEQQIKSRVGDFLYGYGDDNSLVEVVIKRLIKANLTLTAAESLTAGLFQSTIGEVPGVSAIFPGGFVTYAAAAKTQLIGVPQATIASHGVVSEATAKAMAQRARQVLQTDIGISFTGVAGPEALEGQPAGTVWIGLSILDQPVFAREFHFSDDRQLNRWRAVMNGLNLILRALPAEK